MLRRILLFARFLPLKRSFSLSGSRSVNVFRGEGHLMPVFNEKEAFSLSGKIEEMRLKRINPRWRLCRITRFFSRNTLKGALLGSQPPSLTPF